MTKTTSGNSGNAPIEGEFERLRQQAESIDAERDRYDSPESQPQPQPRRDAPSADPDDDDIDDHEARVAAVWLCRWLASGVNTLWPALSYPDAVIEKGGEVLAPLVKKYAAASMPMMQLFARFEHELAALWFFGIIIGASIDRVRATKRDPSTRRDKVQYGPQATATSEEGETSEDGEPLNTGTVWQQEAPKSDARPDVG